MSQNYKILYVDDEKDNLTAFRAVLRRYYQIYTAQSGEEALQLLEETAIDLVVSDQRMPKMTGVELFEKISVKYPEIIRMVLTGYSDIQSIIDAINKGKVNHFITKPWNVKELRVVLDNALETYSLKEKNRLLAQENSELLFKAAKLEKEHILSQYEILKNQINPHFLFNSMNILSSLIPRNPQTAVKFTKQFSKVFRTLLELNEELLIPLEQELDFIKSYLFLQKMRFDKSLEIQVRIAKSKLKLNLPPFGLQLLIENAIKHNIISEEMPLNISISNEGDYLKVSNNLQLRGGTSSTGIGLKNLKARYKLLTDAAIILENDGKDYVAKIPLIE
jgi:sensor histidine kinase YesM